MKGWVYVISNKAMHGLVKIGFSSNDPDLRADDLNHTGSPHPYAVDYDMLIEEPRQVEQKAHRILSAKREGKEWFRCTVEEAIAAIKEASEGREITESYKRAERERAEALHKQSIRDRDLKRRQAAAQHELEVRLQQEEAKIHKTFEERIAASCPPRPFWHYWLGGGILVFILFAVIFFKKMSDSAALVSSAFWGALVGWGLQEYFEGKRKQSPTYRALEQERDRQIALSRSGHEVHQETSKPAPIASSTPLRDRAEPARPSNYQASTWGNPSALVQRGLDFMNGTGLQHNDGNAVDCFVLRQNRGVPKGSIIWDGCTSWDAACHRIY